MWQDLVPTLLWIRDEVRLCVTDTGVGGELEEVWAGAWRAWHSSLLLVASSSGRGKGQADRDIPGFQNIHF